MRIELDDMTAAVELVQFLRSFDCSARPTAARVVEVEFKQQSDDGGRASLDRIRLDAFIRVWNSLHPGAPARVLDDRPVASL